MAVSAINPSPASVVHRHAPTGAQTGGADHRGWGGRPSRAHPFRTGYFPPGPRTTGEKPVLSEGAQGQTAVPPSSSPHL